MPHFQAALTPSSPLSRLSNPPVEGAGLVMRHRDQLGLATVLVRKGRRETLRQHLFDCFQIELPTGPRYTKAGDFALVGTGPDAWLAIQEQGANAFAALLRRKIAELASVSEQSDGYVVLSLSGLRVRETLAKLVPIDLHPRAFRVGDVASTTAAHVSATLWRLDDGQDGCAVFEIAIFRSFASGFCKDLLDSAAEYSNATAHY